MTSSAPPGPRPDGFQPSTPCWRAQSAVAHYMLVNLLQNHALLSKKKVPNTLSKFICGTQYSWASDTCKVITFSPKCCETFRNCSSCSHVSIWDSQTRKNTLQSPGWRRRYSHHRKAIQHSLLALEQPNRSNLKVAAFGFKWDKHFKCFKLLYKSSRILKSC